MHGMALNIVCFDCGFFLVCILHCVYSCILYIKCVYNVHIDPDMHCVYHEDLYTICGDIIHSILYSDSLILFS